MQQNDPPSRPDDPNNVLNKMNTVSQDKRECDEEAYWYTPATHSIAHTTDNHLWQNMVTAAIAGTILELTESSARVLLTVLVSGPASAGGHGIVYPNNPVRGVSGVVFAFIIYQLALAAKNFREMRIRQNGSFLIVYRSTLSATSTRLVFAALLLASEIVLSATTTNVSHAGHAAGAAAGFFCGLAFGSNVVIDPLEIVIPFVGVLGLFGMILGILASEQFYAAVWMWFATLASLPLIYKEVARWGRDWHLEFSATPAAVYIKPNPNRGP